jgi:hypothetical protein
LLGYFFNFDVCKIRLQNITKICSIEIVRPVCLSAVDIS